MGQGRRTSLVRRRARRRPRSRRPEPHLFYECALSNPCMSLSPSYALLHKRRACFRAWLVAATYFPTSAPSSTRNFVASMKLGRIRPKSPVKTKDPLVDLLRRMISTDSAAERRLSAIQKPSPCHDSSAQYFTAILSLSSLVVVNGAPRRRVSPSAERGGE